MSGSSYADLQKQIINLIAGTPDSDGILKKYTAHVATDAINQFSGQCMQIVSAEYNFEWYAYLNSNIATTRPWCFACTDRTWFHISEIPKVIKGDFPEFKKYDGKIYDKTGLPSGMIEGTDVTNFMVNRGGYNCGHQWNPVLEDIVPQEIKDRVFASKEYKEWKEENNKIRDLDKEKITRNQRL